MSNLIKTVALTLAAATVMTGSALAGGLERGGYNIDLLFDPSRATGEASFAYVMPSRELNNVMDTDPTDGVGADGIGGGSTDGVGETESYLVPRVGFKAGLGRYVDCMVDYSQPYGAHSNPGADWMGANSNIETKIDTDGVAGTCSAKFDVGPGQMRVIGGVSYLDVSGFKDRLVAPVPVLAPGAGTGVGRLQLAESGYGWRAGVAYEIPEIALRVSLMYYSEVELDNITGTLDLTEIPGAINPTNPLLGTVTDVYGSAVMPEVIELKAQSGIAPGWLAFGSVKWVDWSQLQSVAFCPESTRALGVPCTYNSPFRATSLDLLYQDGWTVSGGIGHQVNEQLSVAGSFTWDRGTTTGTSTQTDTWTFGFGGSYTPNENTELRLGGALGVLTSGSVGPVTTELDTFGDDVSYDFGNDLVGALSASFKVRF